MARRVHAALLAAFCVALAAWVSAQARWAQPYRQGRDAVNEGRYKEGIALLERAIAIDRRQARVKRIDGTFTEEYFPFYYLGVAYLRIGEYDKAEEAFRNARQCDCLTDQLEGLLRKYEGDVRAARSKPKPDPPPPPPGPDQKFLRGLKLAAAAMGQRRFGEVLELLETLQKMDPAEYDRRNLAARRGEAMRGLADELVREGDDLQRSGQLTAARAKYQDANTRASGSGQRGLDEILSRQNQYAKLKGGAEADIKANRIDAALDKLKQAQGADPEQFARDGLEARIQDLGRRQQQTGSTQQKVRELLRRAQERVAAHDYGAAVGFYGQALNADPANTEAKNWLDANAQFEKQRDAGASLYKEGRLDEAVQALENARQQSPDRFAYEKLDALLEEIAGRIGALPEEQVAPVRAALVTYLRGDAAAARTQLEEIAGRADTLDPRVRAHVFAWLGVAYADLAITARAEAERAELRARALERFAQLFATEPGYQLRDRLISPQILELLNEARSKK